MIIGGVATIPPREKTFRRMLKSVLPQVDEIHVYLSGYVGYLRNLPDRVIQHKPIDGIDLCDAGKFVGLGRVSYWQAKNKGPIYYLSFDDDLLYPFDYADRLVKGIDDYPSSICTFHGRSFARFPIKSYYRSATRRLYCLRDLKKDTHVHVGGTGCMGFRPIKIGEITGIYPIPHMADVHMAVYCKNKAIPIVCLAHKGGWIRHLPVDHNTTIYRQQVNHDEEQTRRINEAFG